MSDDVGQQSVVLNADTLRIILGINAAIQRRDAKLTLNGKQVLCVALDGTCTFDAKEVDEIMLTNDQLIDLGEQALEYSVKHGASRQAHSLEEFVASGTSELQALANEGNEVAEMFLGELEEINSAQEKLSFFGEMRFKLMRDSIGPQSRAVRERLFPE